MRTRCLPAVRRVRRPGLHFFALLLLLGAPVAGPSPAAAKARPYTPLHGALVEIARTRGVPLEHVLADPEAWLRPEPKRVHWPEAMRGAPAPRRPLAEDPPIAFGFPRVLGEGLSNPLAGDFDGDGVLDVVAWTTAGDVLAILEGDETHPLETRRDVSLDLGDVLLAVADLDQDGRTDLLAARAADSTIATYHSLGASGFDAPVRYAAGNYTRMILTLDLDGSGKIDLLAIPNGEGEVVAFLNDGFGGLATAARVTAHTEWQTATSADFDGDQRPDFAVANLDSSGTPRIQIYRNESDTTLAHWIDLPDSGSHWYGAQGSLRAAHINGDDELDLVGFGNSRVRVLRGLGGGAFESMSEVLIPNADDPFPQAGDLRIIDINQDGYMDVLVAARSGNCYFGGCPRVSLLLGSSSGVSAPIQWMGADPNGFPGAARGLALGDFDLDDAIDVVVSFGFGGTTTLNALLSDGPAGLETPVSVDLGLVPRALNLLRRGAGEAPDLLIGDGDQTWVASDVDARGFARFDSLAPGEVVATIDLNADTLEDLVFVEDGEVVVRMNDGAGGFAAPLVYSEGSFLACADFDGTSGPDLAVADGSGFVRVLPNDGSGAFGFPAYFGVRLTSDVSSVAGFDVDGDGLADLLVGHDNGAPRDTLAIHWNLGGLFGPADRHEIGKLFEHPSGDSSNTTRPSTIAPGDFNGDGWRDLFVVNFTFGDHEGSHSILLCNGPRTFAASADYQTGKDPWEGVVADFDRDGRDDVAVACDNDNYNGVVDVFRAEPDGAMTRIPGVIFGTLTAEHYTTSIATGDWDLDGRPDLVVGNRFSSSVTFFRHRGLPPDTTPTSVPPITAESPGRHPGILFAGARPNPARGLPVLHFTLPIGAAASLDVFDVGGRRVATQRLDAPAPGEHAVRIKTERPLRPGFYLARISQAGRSATARITIVP